MEPNLESFNYYDGDNVIRFLVEKRNKQLQDISQQFKIKITSESLNHLEIQGDSNAMTNRNEIIQLLKLLTSNWKEEEISMSEEWYMKIKKIYSSSKKSIILEYINKTDGQVRVKVCGIQSNYYESELNKIKNGESSDEDSDTSTEDHDLYDSYLNINNKQTFK